MENNLISGLCYELYKIDWMNRISRERRADALKNWYESTELSDRSKYTFGDFIADHGYDGESYVCFAEFLEREYLDATYMKFLFR